MVKGFSEMPKSRHDQEPSNNVDTDLKATSEDYLKSYKEDVDDSYIIPDSPPSHLTEKNEATSATAQEISRKVPKKKKKVSVQKGPHFRVISKKQKKTK